MTQIQPIHRPTKSFTVVHCVLFFLFAAISAGTVNGSSTEDALTQSVEKVLGDDWLPLIPPRSEFSIGIPAIIKDRQITPLCEKNEVGVEETKRILTNVNMTFSLAAGLRLEALIGKRLVGWLLSGGLLSDSNKVSKLSVSIETVENTGLSIINLRRAESGWPEECGAVIKEEWKARSGKLFAVQSVSYWKNTKIEAFDEFGTKLKLSAESRHLVVKGNAETGVTKQDTYSAFISGVQAVAVRPWRLRKRTVSLGTSAFILEVDSKTFSREEMDNLYTLME